MITGSLNAQSGSWSRFKNTQTASLAIKLLTLHLVLIGVILFSSCAPRKVPEFKPDRTTLDKAFATLAWAMGNNEPEEIFLSFAPQSRFLSKLGGSEGLEKKANEAPPANKDRIYWSDLHLQEITILTEETALLKVVSSYQGELIYVFMRQIEGNWVVETADSFPMPREARFPLFNHTLKEDE